MRDNSGGNRLSIIVLDNVTHLPEESQTLRLGEGFGDEGRLRDSIAIRGIRFAFANHVPDSGQEHAANGDDGFLVTPASLDAAVTNAELGVIFRPNHSIGNLDKNRLEISSRFGDTGRLDVFSALVISGAATRPGDEILDRREHGHVSADFGEDGDSRHGIGIEARDGANPVEGGCIGGDEAIDFSFDFGAVLLKFVDVVKTL